MLLSIGCFVSCTVTHKLSYIKLEMIEPGKFNQTKEMDTIAVFKRDIYQFDTVAFTYHDINMHLNIKDSLVLNHTLSNQCVDALAKNIVNTGYFLKVINYSDSMNTLLNNQYSPLDYNELHKLTGADVCVFLDLFYLKDYLINKKVNKLGVEIYSNFPEFRKSKALESIETNLVWTLSIKGNPTPYTFNEPNKLYYGSNIYPELFGNDQNHRLLLQTAAEYLGMTFAEKLLPAWHQVERTYYHSNNVNLRKAEKLCLSGDYLKAAEIYHSETKNKNLAIAAMANYNMALVCEMEGNIEAALDWLVLSYSVFINDNPEHKFNCEQYRGLLYNRRLEIEHLGLQINPNGRN